MTMTKVRGLVFRHRLAVKLIHYAEILYQAYQKYPVKLRSQNSFNGSVHIARNNAIIDNVVEVVDASRNSCLSSILIPVASESCAVVEGNCSKDEEIVTPEVAQSNPRGEELVAQVCKKDGKDVGADNPTLGKHGSVECSRLPESQGSGYFKLDKCIGLKGNGSSNSSAGVDLIKACSCSFCVKALKKSQKEASLMVERSCRGKGIDKHSQENCPQSSKLESDLMSQWRSLFLHTEDILVRESSQLKNSKAKLTPSHRPQLKGLSNNECRTGRASLIMRVNREVQAFLGLHMDLFLLSVINMKPGQALLHQLAMLF
ncbi:hypothetical protein Acr_27g0003380 [Actinidia rufa]|uniref:Uncharacterized protein n=1 Tax=Actinidia rufa TaxID=165716 RepID=A0A7J0H6C6_9ERIC|nr:hypothetical protein Acr_27g0003380 [Actinidia rufa]